MPEMTVGRIEQLTSAPARPATTLDEVLTLRSENAKLRNTLALHGGDVLSLSGEVDRFRADADEAEAKLAKLRAAVTELRHVWWDGADLDKDKIAGACLALFKTEQDLDSL